MSTLIKQYSNLIYKFFTKKGSSKNELVDFFEAATVELQIQRSLIAKASF